MGFGIKERIVGGVVAGGIAIFGGVAATGDETKRNETGAIVESGGWGRSPCGSGTASWSPRRSRAGRVGRGRAL